MWIQDYMEFVFVLDHLLIVVTFSDREQVVLPTTMSCMMRTDLLPMLFRPSLINWPIRRFLCFYQLTNDSIYCSCILYTTLAHIIFLFSGMQDAHVLFQLVRLSLNCFNHCLVFSSVYNQSCLTWIKNKLFCSSASLLCTSDCIQGPLLYGRNCVRWGLE